VRRLFNSKGLTLVEIIITLAVLGIVIAPLMSMFVTSQKINTSSEIEYRAIQIAQKYMEDIKGIDTIVYRDYQAATDDGTYTKLSGENKYTRLNIPNEDNYSADVELTPATSNSESGSVSTDYGNTMSITAVNVNYGVKTINFTGDIDLSISNSGMIIEGEFITGSESTEKITIDLQGLNEHDNVTMNVENNKTSAFQFYIENSSDNFEFNINVTNGVVKKKHINSSAPVEPLANNILYDVAIKVYKDRTYGLPSEPINTTMGTALFVYKPQPE